MKKRLVILLVCVWSWIPVSLAKHCCRVCFDIHGVLIDSRWTDEVYRHLALLVDRALDDPWLAQESKESLQHQIEQFRYKAPDVARLFFRESTALLERVCPICGATNQCNLSYPGGAHCVCAWQNGNFSEAALAQMIDKLFDDLMRLQREKKQTDAPAARIFFNATLFEQALIKTLCRFYCSLDYYACFAQLNPCGALLVQAVAENPQNTLYIISNAPAGCFERYLAKFPEVFNRFNRNNVVISGEINRMKPDREIFDYFLHKYGVNHDECCLVDDVPENVRVADISCGIEGFLFCSDAPDVLWQRAVVFDDVITRQQKSDLIAAMSVLPVCALLGGAGELIDAKLFLADADKTGVAGEGEACDDLQLAQIAGDAQIEVFPQRTGVTCCNAGVCVVM